MLLCVFLCMLLHVCVFLCVFLCMPLCMSLCKSLRVFLCGPTRILPATVRSKSRLAMRYTTISEVNISLFTKHDRCVVSGGLSWSRDVKLISGSDCRWPGSEGRAGGCGGRSRGWWESLEGGGLDGLAWIRYWKALGWGAKCHGGGRARVAIVITMKK